MTVAIYCSLGLRLALCALFYGVILASVRPGKTGVALCSDGAAIKPAVKLGSGTDRTVRNR